MSSPTPRRIEEVTLDASFVGAGTKALTFTRQTGPAASLPSGPFNSDPTVLNGTLFTPVGLDLGGPTESAARGTVFPNLLSQSGTDFQSQGGVVSASLSGTVVSGGNVSLTKVELVDAAGVVQATIYSDATGILITTTSLPSIAALLGRIPVQSYQALKVTLVASGAVADGLARARYDLGLNAQQPEVQSTPSSL